tara:strand:- start:430 stop:867 length:438 start_codon:yes stop_codon:yes gene_type:complete
MNFFKIIAFLTPFFIFSQNDIKYINSQDNINNGYPFSDAVIVSDIVYLSGKVGRLPNGKLIKGGIEAETLQTLKNIEAVLQKINLTKDNIFKCTCMLLDIKDWAKMSKVYKSFFGRENLPARSAFAGSGLALNARIEIECLAKVN